MLDLSTRWPAEPDWQCELLNRHSLSMRRLHGMDQLLVSGDLDVWHRRLGVEGSRGAPVTKAGAGAYTVRIASDRLLAISISAFEASAGWHEEGFAVTRVGSALCLLELTGADVDTLMERATSSDARSGSRSAAIFFAGIQAIAYRKGGALRLHVDRALAAFVVQWVKGVSSDGR
jgi:hypothetical protein